MFDIWRSLAPTWSCLYSFRCEEPPRQHLDVQHQGLSRISFNDSCTHHAQSAQGLSLPSVTLRQLKPELHPHASKVPMPPTCTPGRFVNSNKCSSSALSFPLSMVCFDMPYLLSCSHFGTNPSLTCSKQIYSTPDMADMQTYGQRT